MVTLRSVEKRFEQMSVARSLSIWWTDRRAAAWQRRNPGRPFSEFYVARVHRQMAAGRPHPTLGNRGFSSEVGSGVEIVSFQLLYVHPPGEVHDAFRDVASSQEDKLRTINRANTFAVETMNQAKGEAAAMIEQAQAFKQQQVLHAQGDADNFTLKLGAYRRAPELTKFRLQVESIEETLPGLQKFIMPDARDIKDFDMWLLQPAGVARNK